MINVKINVKIDRLYIYYYALDIDNQDIIVQDVKLDRSYLSKNLTELRFSILSWIPRYFEVVEIDFEEVE